jgi:hypothetical protein
LGRPFNNLSTTNFGSQKAYLLLLATIYENVIAGFNHQDFSRHNDFRMLVAYQHATGNYGPLAYTTLPKV